MAGLVVAVALTGAGFGAKWSAAPSRDVDVPFGTGVVDGLLPADVGAEQVGLYAVYGSWTLRATCTSAGQNSWRCPLPAATSTRWLVAYAAPGGTPEVGSPQAAITPLLWFSTDATG